MAKTVDEGFRTFLGRLTPSGGYSDAAKNHRASIEACLNKLCGVSEHPSRADKSAVIGIKLSLEERQEAG